MFELPMAASNLNKIPSVAFKPFDDITNFHYSMSQTAITGWCSMVISAERPM